jgi:hypothetical protein
MDHKFDAPTKEYLQRVEEGSTGRVSLLVRGTKAFDQAALDALAADGLRVRTVAGDVLTADGEASSLPLVAVHDFVSQVSVSPALYIEAPDPQGPASLGDAE